jgi:hypothetical protein
MDFGFPCRDYVSAHHGFVVDLTVGILGFRDVGQGQMRLGCGPLTDPLPDKRRLQPALLSRLVSHKLGSNMCHRERAVGPG